MITNNNCNLRFKRSVICSVLVPNHALARAPHDPRHPPLRARPRTAPAFSATKATRPLRRDRPRIAPTTPPPASRAVRLLRCPSARHRGRRSLASRRAAARSLGEVAGVRPHAASQPPRPPSRPSCSWGDSVPSRPIPSHSVYRTRPGCAFGTPSVRKISLF